MNKELAQDHMASKWWKRDVKPVPILTCFLRQETISLCSAEFFNEVKETKLVLPILLVKSKPKEHYMVPRI